MDIGTFRSTPFVDNVPVRVVTRLFQDCITWSASIGSFIEADSEQGMFLERMPRNMLTDFSWTSGFRKVQKMYD